MNEPVTVSIITPSYNQGEYIEETIQSVLNQTYDHVEYVIVDGGSTDNTVQVLEKYKGQFELIYGPDKGQSDAINKGMRVSSGDLIGWLNADDLYERDGVEKIVSLSQKRPNQSIYYGVIRLINHSGQFLGFPKWGPLTYDRLLRGMPAVWQPGAFYPADLLEDVGYLDPELEMVMDMDLYLRLLQKAPAAFLPEFVARQRIHGRTKSSQQQVLSFREGIRVRLRHDISWKVFLLYLIRRSLILAKFFILNRKQVIEWDAAGSYADLEKPFPSER